MTIKYPVMLILLMIFDVTQIYAAGFVKVTMEECNSDILKAVFHGCKMLAFIGLCLTLNFLISINQHENITNINYIEKYELTSYKYNEETNRLVYIDNDNIGTLRAIRVYDQKMDNGVYLAEITYKKKWLGFDIVDSLEGVIMISKD